jgi:ABC-type nitrate/sulfonate/bicarbonate transport system substrate-binding protein
VKRATKALIKASRSNRDNREEAVKILIAWGKAKPEHAYAAYDSTVKVISDDGGIPEDGLKLLIEQGKRDAKISREIPLCEVADSASVHEVQKELRLR